MSKACTQFKRHVDSALHSCTKNKRGHGLACKRSQILVAALFAAFFYFGLFLSLPVWAQQAPNSQNTQQQEKKAAEEADVKTDASKDQERGTSWSKAPFANFIDIRTRQTAPDAKQIEKGLRILTSDGFAPFNSVGPDGRPVGYHMDMAKLICEDLNMACTIKVVKFEAIPQLLAEGKADIALAGLANQIGVRDKIGFSLAYLQRPARFVVRTGDALTISPSGLIDRPVAVVGRSAHEAYLKAYFPKIKRIAVADLADARILLQDKKVEAIFADAMHLAQIIEHSDALIRFRGKPYLDQHFFGSGMAIAYQREQKGLRSLLDYALVRLAKKGHLAELYARHFPLDIYASY